MASPFQTPANERSFSSLIDEVVLTTGRATSLISIVNYAKLTIRECQAFGLFARDLLEEQVLATASPFIWTRPTFFRMLRAVKYVNASINASSEDRNIFPEFCPPGRIQKNKDYFFYAADDYYVFAGVQDNQTIDLANYYWSKPLVYYGRLGVVTGQFPGGPYVIRPAYFDLSTAQWAYLNTAQDAYVFTTGDPAVDVALQLLSTNWLVSDWRELIISGTKAKVFGNLGDETRANREYAFYKATQLLMSNTVGVETTGF